MYKSIVQESAGRLVLTVPEDMRADLGLIAGAEIEMERTRSSL